MVEGMMGGMDPSKGYGIANGTILGTGSCTVIL
jgi:hypothetical protein